MYLGWFRNIDSRRRRRNCARHPRKHTFIALTVHTYIENEGMYPDGPELVPDLEGEPPRIL